MLLAALLLLPLATKAYVESNGLYYEISSNRSATLIANPNGTKYSGRITIPIRFKKGNLEYLVKAIGDDAFSGCSSLTSVTIGKSVKSIGKLAFFGCSALTSLTIPDNVTVIDTFAFRRCTNLSSLSIGSGLTSMGWGAFAGCENLTQVNLNNNHFVSNTSALGYTLPEIFGFQVKKYVLGEAVTSIGPWAFSQSPQSLLDYNNELASVTIPNSVTSIGTGAFWKCSNLTSVTIPESVKNIGESAFEDCIGLTSASISGGVIGVSAFQGCSNLSSVNLGNVTDIYSHAFDGCESLTSVSLPYSLLTIGQQAFKGCTGLTSISIPPAAWMQDDAFRDCTNLTEVYIHSPMVVRDRTPESSLKYVFGPQVTTYSFADIKSIGRYALYGCENVSSLYLSAKVEEIRDYAFSGCTGLDGILIFGDTEIGDYAFSGCTGFISADFMGNIISIGDYAFSDCSNMKYVTAKSSFASVGQDAFQGCNSLNSVQVANLDSWYNTDFASEFSNPLSYAHHLNVIDVINPNVEKVTKLIVPSGVTEIKNYAFSGCSDLTSVVIPDCVTSIGEEAFYNCTGLTSVTSEIKVPFAFGSEAFEDISPNCVLYVPKGTRNAYIAAGWTEDIFRGGIVEMGGGDDIREKMDVNGDDDVSTADVTAIYSYIINGNSSGFTRGKANVNDDGDVNTADVTAIYNYIINGK